MSATGTALLAARLGGAPTAGPGESLLLLLLLVLAALLGLEFRVRGEGNRLDLFDAALAAALVSLPGHLLLLFVVLAKGTALAAQRVPVLKTCFNMAQWGCAAAAGALVFAALRAPGPVSSRDLLLLLVALLVVVLVNAVAVDLVLVAVSGRGVLRAAPGLPHGIAVGTLMNMVLGLLSAGLWTQAPASRPVVPVALVAVHMGTRLWAQQRAGASRLVGLQRAGASLAGPDDLSVATPCFLEELRNAFQCRGVELHLQLGREGQWTRTVAGCDAGAERSAALVAELLRRGTAVRLAPPDGDPELQALLSAAGWRDCLAAPVLCEGRLVGVLCTHDREGWEGFEASELAVLESAARGLSEAVQRDRLTQVLRAEQAALRASETRWRALARVLELVARGTPLPETLQRLARELEEQTDRGRCAVLVRTPDQPLAVAAPSLPAPAAAALETVLGPTPGAVPGPTRVRDLAPVPGAPDPELPRDALLAAGVRTVQTWPVPCSPDSGAAGVLALCYPDAPPPPEHGSLASGAARVAGLAVDHVLVQDRLAHQAAHDALTDLPNRSVFLDRLDRALRSTERGSTWVLVMFLDLDRFKVVNDSLGHRAGDALLRAVAERLRAAVRPGDTVARFGGDEFTILCEDVENEAHALQVVQRVQDVLAPPFPLGSNELFATGSIGIALGRGSAHAPETLVENADAAMYRAKARGGNCFEMFDDEMRDRAVRRLTTQSALHRAIERDEFRVVYQPTVQLATGAVSGAEALLRWDRPDHGVVLPGTFVPLAEETGLIVPIGARVLEEACRQARRWQDETRGKLPPAVSVNLSARQLTDPGLVPLVAGALQRSGVDPAAICLEITESVLVGDVSTTRTVLSDLKALGVRLFVDDFGTGYSSLTYLQRFPVDGVKVDRAFVAGLGAQRDATAIVRAVIGLAHGLGLIAVAEGVETEEQVDHLVDLQCDVAQGYHFSPPVPPDQIVLGDGERLGPVRCGSAAGRGSGRG